MKVIQDFFKCQWKSNITQTILVPWAVIFLILNIVNTQDGGPNAVSRFVAMRSMDELFSFRIDERVGASADWARTPDGHYYSNKAPGPMLLGFPTFALLDQIPRVWEKGYRDEYGLRHAPGYFQRTITSFVNQIFPLLILLAVILNWLAKMQVSRFAQIAFLFAVFWGSTVSMYFNNYSGHAFEAILQLAMLYCLLRGYYTWVGFFAGSALLSDYGFAIQTIAFTLVLFYVANARREWKPAIQGVLLGAILPGILWIWYHTSCFGSPFLITKHFENPAFQDTLNEEHNILGIIRLPNLFVLQELLVGRSRGLLFTQPWILLLFPLFFLRMVLSGFSLDHRGNKESMNKDLRFHRKVSALFCGLSLIGLLIMNMSYGGWHGGGAAGPRYLSGVFLCFALWMALELDYLAPVFKWSLILGLGASVLYRALVYGSTILGPNEPVWEWYLGEFMKHSKTPHLRFAIFIILLTVGFIWQRKRIRSQPQSV